MSKEGRAESIFPAVVFPTFQFFNLFLLLSLLKLENVFPNQQGGILTQEEA